MIFGIEIKYSLDAPKRLGIMYDVPGYVIASFHDVIPGIDPIADATEMLAKRKATVIGNVTIQDKIYLLVDKDSYNNLLDEYAKSREEQDNMDPKKVHIAYGRDNGWPK